MAQDVSGEQLYFGLLRSHDPRQPDVRRAALHARRYADLARRCLAALGEGDTAQLGLAAPALAAILEDNDIARFQKVLSLSADAGQLVEHQSFLCGLFAWLADVPTPLQGLPQPIQVWYPDHPGAAPLLYAPCASKPAPPPFRLAAEPPIADWLRFNRPRPAHILAHYDGHGVTMAALTLRYLRSQMVTADTAISFEWTGDIGKLWKRAVPRGIGNPADYATVIMVDCPVHSRKPEHTLKALRRLADHTDQRLLLIDHHADTINLAPQLAELPGVQLVLTDIPACGLFAGLDPQSEALMFTGSLSDKLAGLPTGAAERQQFEAAADLLHRWCLKFSPTPPELKGEGVYPFSPLISALADGAPCTPATIEQALGPLAAEAEAELPGFRRIGAVAVVDSRLSQPGRAWYALLERVMAAAGTSYAVAARLLNGHRANLLLLTHWDDIHVPPIRSFIPAEYQPHCLGHSTAVWIDLDVRSAAAFLGRVLDAINSYCGESAEARPVVESVQQNIYEAAPVLAEPLHGESD